MRKRAGILVAATAVAYAFGASASALNGPKVLSFLDIESANVQPINGFTFNRLPRAGDQFAIRDNLYKWAGGKRGALVGHVNGIGTFQSVGTSSASVLFLVQAYVPGGSVVVQGYGHVAFQGPSKFTFPVVGGTGAYANARGYAVVSDIGNGNGSKSRVVLHLTT
jgi:dirigent-like protein